MGDVDKLLAAIVVEHPSLQYLSQIRMNQASNLNYQKIQIIHIRALVRFSDVILEVAMVLNKRWRYLCFTRSPS